MPNLLPYHHVTIATAQPLADVLEVLENHIEPYRLEILVSRHQTPYAGKLSESGFEIRRVVGYRNSFLPKIIGRFEPQPDGTRIHLKMHLHPLVSVFLGIWFVIWYAIAIPLNLSEAFVGMPIYGRVVFLTAPLLVLLVAWWVFWAEVRRSQQDLMQIIQGHVLPNSS